MNDKYVLTFISALASVIAALLMYWQVQQDQEFANVNTRIESIDRFQKDAVGRFGVQQAGQDARLTGLEQRVDRLSNRVDEVRSMVHTPPTPSEP